MRRAKNKRRKSGLAMRAHLSNESNSSSHTLFNFPLCLPKDECYDDCDDPVDSFEISLFDELDACYACGQDATTS